MPFLLTCLALVLNSVLPQFATYKLAENKYTEVVISGGLSLNVMTVLIQERESRFLPQLTFFLSLSPSSTSPLFFVCRTTSVSADKISVGSNATANTENYVLGMPLQKHTYKRGVKSNLGAFCSICSV